MQDNNGNVYRGANEAVIAPNFRDNNQGNKTSGMTSIPIPMQKTFVIRHRSAIDGQTYEGQFTTRKLSIKDIAAIGVRRTQLNGGYHYNEKSPGTGIDETTDWTHTMIAHLELSLIQYPSWFNLDLLYDGDLLMKVFTQVAEFENNFFRTQRGETEPGRGFPNDSSGTSKESGNIGHITQVDREEVQSTLDP